MRGLRKMIRRKPVLNFSYLLIVLSLSIFAGCGGGGDGGVAPQTPTPAPTLPNLVTFGISAPSATPGTPILTASIAQPPPNAPVDIRLMQQATPGELRIAGTVDRTTGVTTINPDPPGFLRADTGPSFAGTVTCQIAETIQWGNTELPTQGAIRVVFTDPDTQVEDSAVVRIVPDAGGGLPGVSLDLESDVNPPTLLIWDDFLNLTSNPVAPPFWHTASLMGYSSYDFLFRRVSVAFDALENFIVNNTAMETAGATGMAQPCDVFPPATGTAGETRQIWRDANTSGDLNSGDAFDLLFNECWADDPASDIDTMFRGRMGMVGYTENASPLFFAGEFIFDNFDQLETTAAVVDEASKINTNGRFSLQLTP